MLQDLGCSLLHAPAVQATDVSSSSENSVDEDMPEHEAVEAEESAVVGGYHAGISVEAIPLGLGFAEQHLEGHSPWRGLHAGDRFLKATNSSSREQKLCAQFAGNASGSIALELELGSDGRAKRAP